MRRIFAFLVVFFSFATIRAQGEHYEFGANVGMQTLNNYPALSLLQDATDSYTGPIIACHFGFLRDNVFYGVQLQSALYNTSAVSMKEVSCQNQVALMGRRYDRMGERFESVLGLKFGLCMTTNSLSYLGEDINRTRIGLYGEFEIGVNYLISNSTYLGLSANFGVLGANFKKNLNLPAGLVENEGRTLDGYGLMMQVGHRF